MGYYVSNMFGIRVGGVFGGDIDQDHLKKLIAGVVLEMRKDAKDSEGAATYVAYPDLGDKEGDVSHCMSKQLTAHKGSYVVLAGVFNYWTYDHSSEFAKRLSKATGCEVMHMCWDEERDEVQCNVWLAGKPAFEVAENSIGRIIRRVT